MSVEQFGDMVQNENVSTPLEQIQVIQVHKSQTSEAILLRLGAEDVLSVV